MTLTLATSQPAPAWAGIQYAALGKRWIANMLYGDVYGFPCGALLWREDRTYRPCRMVAHYALMTGGVVYVARETTRVSRDRSAAVDVVFAKLATCGLDWREAVQLWVCPPDGLAGAEMIR